MHSSFLQFCDGALLWNSDKRVLCPVASGVAAILAPFASALLEAEARITGKRPTACCRQIFMLRKADAASYSSALFQAVLNKELPVELAPRDVA